MPTETDLFKRIQSFLIIIGFVFLFISGYGWYYTVSFNSTENSYTSSTNDKTLNLFIDSGSSKTDKWETMIQTSSFPYTCEVLTGETITCSIENTKKHDIIDWTLIFPIKQECYLNGFWCGDFEIHQFRDGEEIIEVVKNIQKDNSNLKVECNKFSTNLMIHLIPGDYIVYLPSEEVNENVIKSKNRISIGFIFYYKNALDFSDYTLIYHNSFKLLSSDYFKIFRILFIIWLIGIIYFYTIVILKKKYALEMNNSIKSISFMADLYREVHVINLASDTGYLLKGDPKSLMFNFLGIKASSCFKKYIEEDCVEIYRDKLSAFLNLQDVTDILKDVSSIAFEYKSKTRNWCSLRFFKIEKGGQISSLIFSVQDINEEKNRSQQEQDRIKQVEYAQLIRNSFLSTIAYSTEGILLDVLNTNRHIHEILKTEEEKELSNRINCSVEHLKLLQQCVSDMYDIETDSLKIKSEKYNPKQVINKLLTILKPYYDSKPFDFQTQIDSNLPEYLEGDELRLLEILTLILFSAIFVTHSGYVKFSLFTKQDNGVEEMLFSIRDSGEGFTKEQMSEVYSFLAGEKISSFDNPSLVYIKIMDCVLKKMDSELKIVSEYGSGTEFYFSLKQKILEQ